MVYFLAKVILLPILYLLYWPKVKGLENLPKKGKTIIYSNHISLIDPILIGCIMPRRVYFMAKEELFKNPVMRWLLGELGAFPVKRGSADISAVKKALKVLKDEKVFGIFPEGTRSNTGETGDFAHGIASIALKSGAVTVPIVILDRYRLFRRTRIIIGEPLDLSHFYSEKSNNDILERISVIMQNAIKTIADDSK